MLQIADYIAENYRGKVVEVGIGRFTAVAELLARRGFEVFATDVVERRAPEGCRFYVDDVTKPNLKIYEGASLIYSLRPPPELFSAIVEVSRKVGADCLIKPLYGDYMEARIVNYKGAQFYLIRRENYD
ncbi:MULTISPECIES: UPF0146 family protein [Archaeoglobus]|jgi:hypothetical protein|nr:MULTISPECIES: UPF0146 family protein [Archaeoglobus]AIG97616.1 hypothetical protein AFULGI_00008210 [Archaeoglobus fulgidus DSM 8774]KUJ93511.1 MAG: UPF0146 protein [Archaeoglobus fulgidus]KUK07110.1 MAG: hypothetical protein XD48_0649 [Archaeoglobus fulgidus]MDI3496841.1 uncharacterized protein [Archaeoglobus sp.]